MSGDSEAKRVQVKWLLTRLGRIGAGIPGRDMHLFCFSVIYDIISSFHSRTCGSLSPVRCYDDVLFSLPTLFRVCLYHLLYILLLPTHLSSLKTFAPVLQSRSAEPTGLGGYREWLVADRFRERCDYRLGQLNFRRQQPGGLGTGDRASPLSSIAGDSRVITHRISHGQPNSSQQQHDAHGFLCLLCLPYGDIGVPRSPSHGISQY